MKQDINRHEVLEKITPLIENTAMRYGLVPLEINFEKENTTIKFQNIKSVVLYRNFSISL